ncbi:MAG: hypothetical protein HY302_01815 [Opitutae bacterium]|nr:hypothetical protein [Opitutae bacterium]
MLGYALLVVFWRWLNRPAPEQLVQQAKTILETHLPNAVLVSCSRPAAAPNRWIYAALPLTFAGLAIYGASIDRMPVFFVMLTFATIIGTAMLFAFTRSHRQMVQRLTFDPKRRIVLFENFKFVASFLPEKPRAAEEVAFDQILGADFSPAGKNEATLSIRTTKGTVSFTEQMEHFEKIHAVIESLVILNKADRDTYQEKLNVEPEIKTAWYGWLILLGALATVCLLGWKFLYSD